MEDTPRISPCQISVYKVYKILFKEIVVYNIIMSEQKPPTLTDLKNYIVGERDEGYLERRGKFQEICHKFEERKIMNILGKMYASGLIYKDLKKMEDAIPIPVKKERILRDWVWLTVSPKPDVTIEQFKKILHKQANRKLWCEYKYVIEQRGKTEEEVGKGIHAHLLLKRNPETEYKSTRRQCDNGFKNIVDTKLSFVYYWQECRADFLADKLEYMIGVKTGDGKDVKQKMDIIFRQKNNIKNIYENKNVEE